MAPCCEDSRKPSVTVAVLVSCCVFLFVICVCLVTALVFIGKHMLYNHQNVQHVTRKLYTNTYDFTETPSEDILVASRRYFRLPNHTKPILYDLTLLPDLNSGNYSGEVNITIEVSKLTDTIVLHSKNLSLVNISLTGESFKAFGILNVEEIPVEEVIVVKSGVVIEPGVYYLHVVFRGRLTGKLSGFYRSEYKSRTGVSRQIATTKFEPTYARQAFPCFDEPNMKAKYIVHLMKPKDSSYIALSNYPVSTTESYDDNNDLVTFDETVSMSTYLSCFIVSDFNNTETSFNNSGTQIPLKVYASPGNLEKTSYAGEVGKKVIEHYVNYFGIPYPLPKLDLVAIPDFVSGAMEHWGLVTFRETALLYTNKTHSSSNKQRVATVIAHELAHSWFGNLVTMDWWNDLWLNEGFASYIEYKGTLAAEPTWGMLDQFLTDVHTVLSTDASLSSHPIVVTVTTPDEITEIFDTISYNKGAAVLRMLEDTVGEENFRKGVTSYLNKYAFSNAVTENFLSEIQSAVGSTVAIAEMMDTFTIQMGYPVVNVSVDGDNYVLTQKRFLKDSEATYNASESTYGYKWTIPITYRSDAGNSSQAVLFRYNEDSIVIPKPQGSTWIKFNNDQIGYYRVNYPEDQWTILANNDASFSISDRTHLIEESFSLAEAGQLSYTVPLELSKSLTQEMDYVPWTVASSNLRSVLKLLSGSESAQESKFKSIINEVVTPAYEALSWEENADDEHLTRLARVSVLTLACAVDNQTCLSEAETQFNTWIRSRNDLSQDLRGIIYKYGMTNADEATWNALLAIYEAETDATENLKLINGLANIRNTTILSKMIELIKNETLVRSQDYFTVLGYISTNPLGTSLVWDWVRSNWEYLVDRFTLNDRYLGTMIKTITSSFATEERLQEMNDFFEKYPDAGAGASSRLTAIANVENNIRWLAKYKTSVENWIASY